MKSTALIFSLLLASRSIASEVVNRDQEKIEMIQAAFVAYAAKNSSYPQGTNADIVRQLSDPQKGIRFSAELDSEGRMTSSTGRPIVFLFSEDGWVVIAVVAPTGSRLEREAFLPPCIKKTPKSERSAAP